MSDIVSPLLQWLNANPQLAGLVTFIISAGESVAIIGTIVPGSIMMTALGTLAGAGVIPLWETIIWAILGAIVGDGISYWMGYYFRDRLPSMWPFSRYPNFLQKGEIFFHKYGSMSVFIGRFVGPVRALVPLVAGMLRMRPWKFLVANVASAIGWAPAYMLPGILLGAASLELPPEIAIHVILVVMLISLFALLCLWFVYKILQMMFARTKQLQINTWLKLKSSRTFSPLIQLLKHHNDKLTYGQLGLAFYFIVSSVLLLSLIIYVKCVGVANIEMNEVIFHLFRGIRSPHAEQIMIEITLLGQKQVLFPALIAVFAWLLYCKRTRAALHWLALGIFAGGGVFVLKHLIHSPRPWGIFQSPETYSMPSGHATLSAVVYFGLAFFLMIHRSRKWRRCAYSVALLLTVIIAISRLYLGAHWLTDIVAAWLLSIAILMLVIISYQRQEALPVRAVSCLAVFLITLSISYGYYQHRYLPQLQLNYAQINWPIKQIDWNEWWQKDNVLPVYRASLFGLPSDHLNIEWAGDLAQIKATLEKAGWEKPPARDMISTLHRLTDVKSALYLPLVSPQYLDKKPELILTRQVEGKNQRLVLRLWHSNRMFDDTTNLWVGVVGYIPRSYGWLYSGKQPNKKFNVDASFIFASPQHSKWDSKIVTKQIQQKHQQFEQSFILIKPRTVILSQ